MFQIWKYNYLSIAIPLAVEVHLEIQCFLFSIECFALPLCCLPWHLMVCSSALLLSHCLSPSMGWFPQQALRIWTKLHWPGWISTVLFLFWGQVSEVPSISSSDHRKYNIIAFLKSLRMAKKAHDAECGFRFLFVSSVKIEEPLLTVKTRKKKSWIYQNLNCL